MVFYTVLRKITATGKFYAVLRAARRAHDLHPSYATVYNLPEFAENQVWLTIQCITEKDHTPHLRCKILGTVSAGVYTTSTQTYHPGLLRGNLSLSHGDGRRGFEGAE